MKLEIIMKNGKMPKRTMSVFRNLYFIVDFIVIIFIFYHQ